MLLGIILNMDYFMTVCYNFYFTNICQFKVIFFLVISYLYLLIFISCIPKATICEIRAGRWVRNGSQIRSQVQLYVNCHFCNSMLDLDIFLLQVSQSHFRRAVVLIFVIYCHRWDLVSHV